jgi:hypothetical protein
LRKTIFVLFILGMFIDLFPQSYDVNYTIDYALKDARGTVLSKLKLYRSGNKLKFVKIDKAGKPDETTTDMYILKDENQVYTVITNSAGKFGTRHAVELSYVGMQTGVYILDLGNDGTIFNSNSRSGNATVLGMDCVKYTIVTQGDASSDYYMYQDNLMLKRWVGSPTEGNSIEALTFDNTTPVPESLFVVPTDVTYY